MKYCEAGRSRYRQYDSRITVKPRQFIKKYRCNNASIVIYQQDVWKFRSRAFSACTRSAAPISERFVIMFPDPNSAYGNLYVNAFFPCIRIFAALVRFVFMNIKKVLPPNDSRVLSTTCLCCDWSAEFRLRYI